MVVVVWDELVWILVKKCVILGILFICDYVEYLDYIYVLVVSVCVFFVVYGELDLLLFFYYGILQCYVNQGDDYFQCCCDMMWELVFVLGLLLEWVMMIFQLCFGWEFWLILYIDEMLKMFGEKGMKYIQVLCLGFVVDCFEMLEEIVVQNWEIFFEVGGK